jgi:CubicO group peptidase (beta-lactamase class C family)
MKRYYSMMIVLLLVCLLASPAQAFGVPKADLSSLDTFIERYMLNNRIPGVSLVVAQGSQVIYRKGYGTAGPDRSMTTDVPMFIGSQTKSFTALAIMQLVEAGQIKLDAPVHHYIPWFKVADPKATSEITIRRLLNHSSGLSEAGYIPNLPDQASLEQAVRDLQRARPTAAPGTNFQYFNPGYITLGYLIEVISGQSYGEYLRQHVFEPLGMDHTSASIDEYQHMGIAQGYSQWFGFPVPMTQAVPAYYLPAGFIVSTSEDLIHFLIAMGNGGQFNGQRILSQTGVDLMFTPDTAPNSLSGFGWNITSYYGEKEIIHGGANEYFNTNVLILPERGLSVAMIINQDHMFKATYDYGPLFWGVVSHLTGRPIIQQRVSGVMIGYGVLVAFLAILYLSARGLLMLKKERERIARQSDKRRWLHLLSHVTSVGVTLVAVIVIGPALAGRGFDLHWFVGFYPDVALLAGTVLLAETIQVAVKSHFILNLNSNPN